jgi:hypothetical protein
MSLLAAASVSAFASPITSSGDPALSGSTLIDFSSVAVGDYTSLVLPGVTINGIGSPMTVCDGCGGGGGSFGDVGRSLQNTGGSPISFDLLFDNAVSAFGIIGGALNNGWTYTAYDSSNNVIETLNINDPCCGGFFHGIAHDGIKRVNLNGSGDWVVFDNLQFVAAPAQVPEPLSLSLFGIGFAGLALARRRNGKQAA